MDSELPNISGYKDWYELGKGTAGKVYRARDKNGLQYAFKFLTMGYGGYGVFDPGIAKREVDTLSELSRKIPGVPQVYHYDLAADEPYICFQYVGGSTLEDLIQNGSLNLSDRLLVLDQLAAILDTVHTRDIIHRDVKPSNIKKDGELIYLLDFGIAFSENANDYTTGVKGTPRYSAPEPSVQPSYDIFAYGIIAFEVLFGIHPFFTADEAATYRSDESSLRTGIINKIIDKNWRLPTKLPQSSLLPEMKNEISLRRLDEIFEGIFRRVPEDRVYHKARILFEAIEVAVKNTSKFIDDTDYRDGNIPSMPIFTTSHQIDDNDLVDTTIYENKPSSLKFWLIGGVLAVIVLAVGLFFFSNRNGAEETSKIAINTTETETVETTIPSSLSTPPTEDLINITETTSPPSHSMTPRANQIIQETITAIATEMPVSLTTPPREIDTATQTITSLPSPSDLPLPSTTPTITNTIPLTLTIPSLETDVPFESQTPEILSSGNVQGDIIELELEEREMNVSYNLGFLGCMSNSVECEQPNGWIDLHQVTNRAYNLCVVALVCSRPSNGFDPTGSSADEPINLNRRLAERFCRWRGENLDRHTRLPTQTELDLAQQVFEDNFFLDNPEWITGESDSESSDIKSFRCFEPIQP